MFFIIIFTLQKSTHPWQFFNIPRKKNENYVEFDFRMGTVLVIFLFFGMDNIIPSPPH